MKVSFSPYMKSQLISAVRLMLACAGVLAAPAGAQEVPLLKGVDHFFATSPNPEPLYRFFRDTLGLPEIYPFRNYGDFSSGVVSAGNTLFEVVTWGVPAGKTLATELRGIAFESGGDLQATLKRLDANGAVRSKPDSVRMQNAAGERVLAYVNIGLDDAGGLPPDSAAIFINHNLGSKTAAAKRTAGSDSLRARRGGSLGIVSVKELVVGVTDLDGALIAWRKVLDSPSQASVGLITFKDGPALRLVKAQSDGISEMVLLVRSVAEASRFLATLGITGVEQGGELSVSLRGVPARLVGQ